MRTSLVPSIFQPSFVVYDTTDVGMRPWSGTVWGYLRLPTDPIGTFTLTLTNLIVGSAIQIEDQAGTVTLHNQVCDATSEIIVLSAYASGSPLNDLRIKVRKGSAAPYYRSFETLTTAIVGSQSIYIAQIPDE